MADIKHPEYQYLDLMKDILENWSDKELFLVPEVKKQYDDRWESYPFIRSLFGRQTRYDLSKWFPLLTTKKVFVKWIIHELLWFIKWDSNIKYLVDKNVHIWDEWAYKWYLQKREKMWLEELTQKDFISKIKEDEKFAIEWWDLGNVYWVQWRRWKCSDWRVIDQLWRAINELKSKPFRKSIVVSAWNPEYIYAMAASRDTAMALPPCHTIYQFSVVDNKLSLQLYQRSADLFLWVPFNIASYALFTMMLAQVCGFEPWEFVHTFWDVHLYSNHFDQAKEQLTREPKTFPIMKINPKKKNIDDFEYSDFILVLYEPHPKLKAEITNIWWF